MSMRMRLMHAPAATAVAPESRMRATRSAFATTTSDESDMPTAATSGVT